MGKLDIPVKKYMGRLSVSANVFNQLLYHGKQAIEYEKMKRKRKY